MESLKAYPPDPSSLISSPTTCEHCNSSSHTTLNHPRYHSPRLHCSRSRENNSKRGRSPSKDRTSRRHRSTSRNQFLTRDSDLRNVGNTRYRALSTSTDFPFTSRHSESHPLPPVPCPICRSIIHNTYGHTFAISYNLSNLRTQLTQCPGPPPRKLRRFSELPFEIRIMIWDYAKVDSAPQNRLIELGSKYPIPALLHVNREARTQALMKYKAIKASPFDKLGRECPLHWFIYIDPASDYLYVPSLEPSLDGTRRFVLDFWKKVIFYREEIERVVMKEV